MRHSAIRRLVIALILTVLTSAGCEPQTNTTADRIEPAQIVPIEGTDLNHLILTERAAERLGIETAPVREEHVDGARRTVIPYAAVIYDTGGGTWAYVNTDPLTFVRQAITIDYVDGDTVILIDGPPAGAEVVTVGVSELYGADTGVGK